MRTYDFSELSDIQLFLSAIKKNCEGSIYIYIESSMNGWSKRIKKKKKNSERSF